MQRLWIVFVTLAGLLAGCEELTITRPGPPSFPVPSFDGLTAEEPMWPEDLDREAYQDKILGLLVGSAIGDAMGAPTEMWSRDDIEVQWGYVNRLDDVIREGSPEGPWDFNLPAGGTTDDTRWKFLMGKFLTSYTSKQDSLDPKDFAEYIIAIYLNEKDQISRVTDFDPDRLETEVRHMTWLQEWAKVARPYLQKDIDGYAYALNKFYGGEMACAGMLYTPMIGSYYPGAPYRAYQQAYRLGLFDLGYARDISALTSAYIAQAFNPSTNVEEILAITKNIDPNGYFKSRLVGRIAHQIYLDARKIVHQAIRIDSTEMTPDRDLPSGYRYGGYYHAQVEKAYDLLDDKLQDIPFHANEIHLINLTGILFTKGDFERAIEFVVNFGRDNDTVAAVTGAILGAYWGAERLPSPWVEKVTETSRNIIGIDLEALAQEIVDVSFPSQ